MDVIKEWEEKGFRIGIFPIIHQGRFEWTSGVLIGNSPKMTWFSNKDEGCHYSSFISYENALNAAVNFCLTYKPKKTINVKEERTSKKEKAKKKER